MSELAQQLTSQHLTKSQLKKIKNNPEYQRRMVKLFSELNNQGKEEELSSRDKLRQKINEKRVDRSSKSQQESYYKKETARIKTQLDQDKKKKAKKLSKNQKKRHNAKMQKLNERYGDITLEQHNQCLEKVNSYRNEQALFKQEREEFPKKVLENNNDSGNEADSDVDELEPERKSEIYPEVESYHRDMNIVNLYRWQQKKKSNMSQEEADAMILGENDDALSDLSELSDD